MEIKKIERIVGNFKKYNNASCRITNALIDHFNKVEASGFTADEMEIAIGTVSAESIYDIINETFLNLFREKNTEKIHLQEEIIKREELIKSQKEEIEKKKEFKIEEEQSNMNLGILEKAMARVMLDEYAPQFAEKVMADAKAFIEQEYGKITKTIKYELPQTGGCVNEVTHEEFETVLNFVMADEPVMLIGPAGTGKNVICKQIAKAMNIDFYFSNAVTQEYKLTGFIDANGTYHETPFYKAFTQGGLFMLDEIDASIPEVLVILNAAIANRYFDFPTGEVEAHKDFRVVAAGNTFGTGASYTYSGRNQLDGASLDRFAQVYIDYSENIENSLTSDNTLLNFIRKFRTVCIDHGINHIVSYRSINRLEKMAKIMPIKKVLQTCLIKNLEKDDLRMMAEYFEGNSVWEEGFRQLV